MAAQPKEIHDEALATRLGAHARGPAYEWALWSTTVRLVTADPHALPSARRLVDAELARVELAVGPSGFDGEVGRLTGGRTRVSSTLAAIVAAAVRAARETDGAADPTCGRSASPNGADPDGERPGRRRVWIRPSPGSVTWGGVEVDEVARTVRLAKDVDLDLAEVATAWAADRCAYVVADLLEVGVLVSIGGDIATAGPPGCGSWEILVEGRPQLPGLPDGAAALVAVPTGLSVATSSTSSARVAATSRASAAGRLPTGRRRGPSGDGSTVRRMPGPLRWRSATVVAPDCVTANAWSVAATSASADDAAAALAARGLPARLVAFDGSVRLLGGWPLDAELTRTA